MLQSWQKEALDAAVRGAGKAPSKQFVHDFYAAYMHNKGNTSMLQDWQQRVIAEHRDLVEKGKKLAAFLISPEYTALPPADQDLLRRQAAAMIEYASVLQLRINRFQGGGETMQLASIGSAAAMAANRPVNPGES